jgi:hypothetical protein
VVPLLEKKIECYHFRYLQSLKQIVNASCSVQRRRNYFSKVISGSVCELKMGVVGLEGMHLGHYALV